MSSSSTTSSSTTSGAAAGACAQSRVRACPSTADRSSGSSASPAAASRRSRGPRSASSRRRAERSTSRARRSRRSRDGRGRAGSYVSSSSSRTPTPRSTRAGRSARRSRTGSNRVPRGTRCPRSCALRAGRPAGDRRAAVPTRVLRRAATTHRDRPCARRRPVGDRPRRAARLARRVGAGAAREPAHRPVARPRPRHPAHLARPLDRAARRRRRLGDVPRHDGRDRPDPSRLDAARPSLQRGADRGRPAPGRAGVPAGEPAGRGARPRPPAERLPLPPPLRVRVRPLPHRRAAARRARRGPHRGLLAAPGRLGSGSARGPRRQPRGRQRPSNRVIRCQHTPSGGDDEQLPSSAVDVALAIRRRRSARLGRRSVRSYRALGGCTHARGRQLVHDQDV